MPRLSTRSGTIAVDCLNCASCDPALSECAAAMRAVPAPSPREGGKNKLTLILAIAVPVAVVVLVVLAFMVSLPDMGITSVLRLRRQGARPVRPSSLPPPRTPFRPSYDRLRHCDLATHLSFLHTFPPNLS
ncbi:hypothetical protein CC85DRAFT_287571 [Cutaneotrichosporon oleaginosum]|uniref:Uncharacterized protein n=1 Tax=Cutaneotrichosporon oleaginosum TaxID=879819 RepID=A0A0J0XGY6_9TREE|nr:uncharacterized protein CC85DRAFT_287571 [Cutaneotrichosporon oleaginosum]KLT40350.1 hypothetical protein CC85DRAFT_287571 [Cutaneotrichosporon oleaginosum]TXT06485.1 hypothetical protein COLE_05816 [Cutaneotrichosporon oleaginosum]